MWLTTDPYLTHQLRRRWYCSPAIAAAAAPPLPLLMLLHRRHCRSCVIAVAPPSSLPLSLRRCCSTAVAEAQPPPLPLRRRRCRSAVVADDFGLFPEKVNLQASEGDWYRKEFGNVWWMNAEARYKATERAGLC